MGNGIVLTVQKRKDHQRTWLFIISGNARIIQYTLGQRTRIRFRIIILLKRQNGEIPHLVNFPEKPATIGNLSKFNDCICKFFTGYIVLATPLLMSPILCF
jgi:hypothetical protein